MAFQEAGAPVSNPKSRPMTPRAPSDGCVWIIYFESLMRMTRAPCKSVVLRVLRCALNGAITSWVQVPPGQWSVGPVAGGRRGWATIPAEAPRQRLPRAVERTDGP
jgi:hypothetical protein